MRFCNITKSVVAKLFAGVVFIVMANEAFAPVPPPTLFIKKLPAAAQITIHGWPFLRYAVLTSDSLAGEAVNWVSNATVIADNYGNAVWMDTNAPSHAQRYYKAYWFY